jgi:hypothetical protein
MSLYPSNTNPTSSSSLFVQSCFIVVTSSKFSFLLKRSIALSALIFSGREPDIWARAKPRAMVRKHATQHHSVPGGVVSGKWELQRPIHGPSISLYNLQAANFCVFVRPSREPTSAFLNWDYLRN